MLHLHGPLPLSLATLTLSSLRAEVALLTGLCATSIRCGVASSDLAAPLADLDWCRAAVEREQLYLAQRIAWSALRAARVATQRPNVEGWARAIGGGR